MLRLSGSRVLGQADLHQVHAMLAADSVASCMVAARVEFAGVQQWRLGGQLWGYEPNRIRAGGGLTGLCYSGPNLIPLHGDGAALRSFADRALRSMRICSSVVGPADLVLDLWEHLEYGWGPARAIRESQPLMALTSVDRKMVDSAVRLVRREELELYLPAAVAMFKEEIGTDPTEGDDGKNYRARVAELIDNQRAFARFENGKVVFKAEIGALSAHCGQIQGVWVDPEYRGRGLGTTGTGAVAAFLTQRLERTASLYVNSFNAPALAAYRKLGFRQVGQYATVLL